MSLPHGGVGGGVGGGDWDWPAGYARCELSETDSTNAEALRRARAGETGPVWIRANLQSAGRGRRGNVWTSEGGNLFATLLMSVDPPAAAAQLSFAAALAASDMLAALAPAADIKVKWPNDVLADGGKVAGILLERDIGGPGGGALAIGIGVNLVSHPDRTAYGATSLAALGGRHVGASAALILLARAFAHWHEVWKTAGFAPLRTAWLARVAGLGAPIAVRLEGREEDGIFAGVDEDGALLLGQGPKRRKISAGDVFFPQGF